MLKACEVMKKETQHNAEPGNSEISHDKTWNWIEEEKTRRNCDRDSEICATKEHRTKGIYGERESFFQCWNWTQRALKLSITCLLLIISQTTFETCHPIIADSQ